MSKKNIILLIVLAALIALAYFYQVPLKKWQVSLGQPQNFLAGLAIDNVDKIEIVNNGKTVALEKRSNVVGSSSETKWKISGTKDFYADRQISSQLVEDLKSLAKADLELVSSSQDRKSEFGVNASGVGIKLYENDQIKADFIIGQTGSDYVSTYISSAQLAATYAAPINLSYISEQEDWRDKTIFSSDIEKINKIRFQYPNREFTIEKKDGQWQGTLPEKFSVSSDKINKILDIMSNLQASQIPEQKFAGTGLDKHLIIIEATGEGLDNVLMVGQLSSDNLYFAKKGDSDNVYLIAKVQRDELDKWIWQLK